ncbi:hypothetical protein QAD02_000694 [Eretmocerus hayati]|uniref:Uncharacterized protein n=1 Tax=Eretmocerus hayati TaxID=131215 RepID=A0ACC2NIP9_9HYME|nr:hypothetical protein QAD02_000694 [Eretmocerus hayati]
MFPECLHALCLGGGKTILGVQVESTFPGSIKNHLGYINSQLKSIRPPYTVARITEELTNWRRLKGHQLLDWILIYSTPILQEVLSDREDYFQHWILLVISMHTLFKREIKLTEVATAKILLNLFGRDLDSLYGDRILTYYMHQLSKHLADYVEKWGPAWANSAFPYESFNAFLARFIHGTKNVNQELVNNIQIYEGHLALKSKFVDPVTPKKLEFRFKMLGRPIDVSRITDVTSVFLQKIIKLPPTPNNVRIHSRAEINGIKYDSKLHKILKTDTSHVHIVKKDREELYGIVESFINRDEDNFVHLRVLKIKHDEMIIHKASQAVVSHILPFEESPSEGLLDVTEISTINPLIKVGKFICKMPNHLRKVL